MSKPLDELGGKCPYMPLLDRGQMSEGEHVRPPSGRHLKHHLENTKLLNDAKVVSLRFFKGNVY